MRLKTPGVLVLTSRRLSPQPCSAAGAVVSWETLMSFHLVSQGAGRSRGAAPFSISGQNVTGPETGNRSATDRERDGQSGEGQQSHGEADGGGAIPRPGGIHQTTKSKR